MVTADLISALLLPLPPWLGFWIFRRKGRVGLSYGYFLGGILALLALPWAHLTGLPVPAAQLGGALLGFSIFLQAQREGVEGIRRLALGVGGATLFLALLLLRLRLPWQEVGRFWAGAALEALLWLVLSDLAYRWTGGKKLEVRMPLVGAAALGLGALAQAFLSVQTPRLPWPAAVLGGLLLGLVALQQLRWLREQGAWVEGRGQGLRMALALVEKARPDHLPGLSLGLDARQPMWMVDDQGRVLESNGAFSRLVDLPRHALRGYGLDALFQGGDTPVWEALRGQLLQFGCATASATQVSRDGSFRPVTLEAATFDRGMALLWIADPSPGALVLRGGGLRPGGDESDRRRVANALTALVTTADHLTAETQEGPLRQAARRVRAAAGELDQPTPAAAIAALEAPACLEAQLPSLRKVLPPRASLGLRADSLPLSATREALGRITTQILLQALDRTPGTAGELTLVLETVDLGGRRFGLLRVEAIEEGPRRPRTLFGLGWLRQSVAEAGGLLELEQDDRGPRLRVYLPLAEPTRPAEGPLLQGRSLVVVERNALAREALMEMVRWFGGRAAGYEDLPQFLRGSRDQAPPDLLVLERTPRLERFQRALRTFQKEPIPTLVLGLGQPLPLDPASLGLRRLGFLEKPFGSDAFARAALALLRGNRD